MNKKNKIEYYYSCPICKKPAIYADSKPTLKRILEQKVNFEYGYHLGSAFIECISCSMPIFHRTFRLAYGNKFFYDDDIKKNYIIHISEFKKINSKRNIL